MGILSIAGKGLSKLASKVLKKSNPVLSVVDVIPSQSEVNITKQFDDTLIGKARKGIGKVASVIGQGVKQGTTNLVTSAVSNPLKTLTAVAVGGPLAVGFLSTKGGREAIKSIPSTAKETGETIGEVVGGERPVTDLTTSDIIKTGAIVGTGTAIVGAGVIAVDKFLDDRNKDGVLGTDDTIPQETGGTTPSMSPSVPVPSSSQALTTPQGINTDTISTGKRKKSSKKRVSVTPSPIVRVNNKVIVNNKNYLKNK